LTPNILFGGPYWPPAIIAKINPHPDSGFASYQDIIRLEKTGIMGLSFARVWQIDFLNTLEIGIKKSDKKKLACH